MLGEEAARSPVVVSSSELLCEKEAEIKKRKHIRQKYEYSCMSLYSVKNNYPPFLYRKPGEHSVRLTSVGDHGNDLMTPPEVLLQKAQRDAKQLTKEKKVHKIYILF